MQQESRENLAVFVAMEIGSSGTGSTSTRSSRRSVMQMLAPPSTIDGVEPEADPAAALLTRAVTCDRNLHHRVGQKPVAGHQHA